MPNCHSHTRSRHEKNTPFLRVWEVCAQYASVFCKVYHEQIYLVIAVSRFYIWAKKSGTHILSSQMHPERREQKYSCVEICVDQFESMEHTLSSTTPSILSNDNVYFQFHRMEARPDTHAGIKGINFMQTTRVQNMNKYRTNIDNSIFSIYIRFQRLLREPWESVTSPVFEITIGEYWTWVCAHPSSRDEHHRSISCWACACIHMFFVYLSWPHIRSQLLEVVFIWNIPHTGSSFP